VRLDIEALHESFRAAREGKRSRHARSDRLTPSLFQYDYLTLSRLRDDVRGLLAQVPAGGGRALDLGCENSPYHAPLVERGFEVETLDIEKSSADYVGTAEETGLPSASFDLVLCTQVLEHCDAPWRAVAEIHRILKPGGHCIVSVPHVWFFHPHPKDHWRFTQEGIVRLCEEGRLQPVVLMAQGGTGLAAAQVASFLAYGVFGRYGAPLYLLLNLLGALGDRLVRNDLFCVNFAVLARRQDQPGRLTDQGEP